MRAGFDKLSSMLDRCGDARTWIPGLLAVILLATLPACGEAPGTSLPGEYLGKWYYTGSSGGIAGDGMGDEPTGYLVIHPDGRMDHHEEDGALIGTTRFRASLGPTIFSAEDLWLVETDAGPPEVIVISEDGQTMTLSQNVYDGFGRSYARFR